METVNRILIINPFGIGDVLFTTPLIRHLRKQFPGAYIGFICNSRVAPFLSGNKNLNEIFVFDKGDFRLLWRSSKTDCVRQFLKFLKIIKSKKFDIAIDLSLGHQYAFFLKILGVPVRIGYNFKSRGRFLTHKIDIAGYHDKHIVEYYLDLLQPSLRAPIAVGAKQSPCNDGEKLDIFIPQKDLNWADSFLKDNGYSQGDKIAAIIPGGGASWGKTAIYKQWPAQNFAQVADELIERRGLKIILLGGEDDVDACGVVSNSMRNRALSACGETDLLQFAALLKKCVLVITNDGGPLHMAVAVGVKTVSLFGPVDENVYGPYPPTKEHIVLKEDINCRPCYREFKFKPCLTMRCLLNIRPQDVIRAAGELLGCKEAGEM